MFTSKVSPLQVIIGYKSDEIHITNKFSNGEGFATLSFIAFDQNNDKVSYAPIVIMILSGAAYQYWYDNWNNEASIYSSICEIIKNGVDGISISSDDFGFFDKENISTVES